MPAEMNASEQEQLIEKISRTFNTTAYESGRFSIKREELPFYKNAFLARITNFAASPAIVKTYIFSGNDVLLTDGSFESVEQLNEKAGLHLSESTAAAYVSFFFSRVYSDEGNFFLITKFEDIPNHQNFDECLAENLKELIEPPAVRKEDDGYVIRGYVLHKTTLFETSVIVSHNGEIDIDDDETVYENLPVVTKAVR